MPENIPWSVRRITVNLAKWKQFEHIFFIGEDSLSKPFVINAEDYQSTMRRIRQPLKVDYFAVISLKLYNFHPKSPKQVVLSKQWYQNWIGNNRLTESAKNMIFLI